MVLLRFYACKFISFVLVISINQVFNYFDAIVGCLFKFNMISFLLRINLVLEKLISLEFVIFVAIYFTLRLFASD